MIPTFRLCSILLVLLLECSAFALPISRRNWILEQLSTPIEQSSLNRTPSVFRAGLNVTNYTDAFSGMMGVLGDLGPLELAAYASQRAFGSFTEAGREYKSASTTDSSSIAGELARGYRSRDGHFGRASAQYIYFPKDRTAFLRVGFNLGVFERPDSPWILRLNTHFYFRAQGDEFRTYSSLVEIGQTVGQMPTASWRLGLFFGWTYKTRDELTDLGSTGAIRNEHMLFSIGPWLEYATLYYHLKMGVPWRLWLDKETAERRTLEGKLERFVHYPSDTQLPDFQFSLSLFL